MRKDRIVSSVLGTDRVLSPSDVLNHEFSRTLFGGYSVADVDGFLARVSDVLEGMIEQVRDCQTQLAEQKEKLDEHRQMEDTLRNALVTSQKFGENLIESAKREAQLLIDAARLEKSRIEREAEQLPQTLVQEIANLQDQRDRLQANIRAILASHESLLESSEARELENRRSFVPTDAECGKGGGG